MTDKKMKNMMAPMMMVIVKFVMWAGFQNVEADMTSRLMVIDVG